MLEKIRSVFLFIGMCIVLALATGISKDVWKAVFSSTFKPSAQQLQQLEEGMIKVAEQLNRRGPIMLDKVTRFDRVEVGPGVRATYFYSLPYYSSQDIELGTFQANIKSDVKESVCANKKMKFAMQYGATYVYTYSGNNGVEIARFEINKNDCS
jgi:hypothetical protein